VSPYEFDSGSLLGTDSGSLIGAVSDAGKVCFPKVQFSTDGQNESVCSRSVTGSKFGSISTIKKGARNPDGNWVLVKGKRSKNKKDSYKAHNFVDNQLN
jgi:hypothetical protein